MRARRLTCAIGAAILCAVTLGAMAQELQIIGTWKFVSGKYNGKDGNLAGANIMLKHVTPEQTLWVIYDKQGRVVEVAGGSYKLNGNEFIETLSYGLGPNFKAINGKSHTFRDKVEGNKWFHNGQLANGTRIEEVWERVERK